MKKIALMVLILGLIAAGCRQLVQKKTDLETANEVKTFLSGQGYTTVIEIKDIDANKISDLSIKYVSGQEDAKVADLLAAVAGALTKFAAGKPDVAHALDKVKVTIGTKSYQAEAAVCLKLQVGPSPNMLDTLRALKPWFKLSDADQVLEVTTRKLGDAAKM